MEYTIRIKKNPKSGWLCGQCEQIPEAITQGRDMEELMFMMKDAIDLVLECKRDDFRKQNLINGTFVRKLRTNNEAKSILKASRQRRLCPA